MTNAEAIKELSYIADEMPSMECADWKEAISMAIKALEQEPKTGHWISIEYHNRLFECSECHARGNVTTRMYEPIWNYCPNCGAKMESEEEE